MAHGTRINGTSYGITGGKCMVGGTAYSIQKGRALIGGTGYDISFGTPLSAYSEGDIVKINESSSPVDFYVAKHNYESSLNGTGRTLVVRKDVYDERQWNNIRQNSWDNCTIRSWLNGTYKMLLDSNIRSLIGRTKYYYTPGNGNTTISTRSDAVFLLSLYELGMHRATNDEGSVLPIDDILLIAHLGGNAVSQWTRSPVTIGKVAVAIVNSNGVSSSDGASDPHGARPIFTLPSDIIVGGDGLIA